MKEKQEYQINKNNIQKLLIRKVNELHFNNNNKYKIN